MSDEITKSFDYHFDDREEAVLEFLRYRQEHFALQSFNKNEHDFALLPRKFSDLYLGGSTWKSLNVDTVKHWALDHGINETIADEMGYTCETVYHTLVHVGKIAR